MRLRIDEFGVELSGDEEANEGPFHKRAANDIRLMVGKPRCELNCQSTGGAWPEAERFKIEPQIPVVPGLEFKVTTPNLQQARQVRRQTHVAFHPPYTKADLQYSKHLRTSATVSWPLYSYSMLAGMGYFFSRSRCNTSLIFVSPSPKGRLSP